MKTKSEALKEMVKSIDLVGKILNYQSKIQLDLLKYRKDKAIKS